MNRYFPWNPGNDPEANGSFRVTGASPWSDIRIAETITHELGHLWHIQANPDLPRFDPKTQPATRDRPGGPYLDPLGAYISCLKPSESFENELEARATNLLVSLKLSHPEDWIRFWRDGERLNGDPKILRETIEIISRRPKTRAIAKRILRLLRREKLEDQ